MVENVLKIVIFIILVWWLTDLLCMPHNISKINDRLERIIEILEEDK